MKLLADVGAVYLHRDAVDFRKSINGLVLIVEQEMALSPFADALFVFCNKSRDKLKLVYWERTGFCMWYKRLEKDKFKWPRHSEEPVLDLTEQQWQWLLNGYDIVGHEPLHYAHCAG
ncbi:MAG: IS66 family insertion sequence element accessory protein TnpB [Gammaproteobacteria bacterium]|nr:IS66 family insertion sequence element accessory protein TnpB [Gammaproteobacteria bacterium]